MDKWGGEGISRRGVKVAGHQVKLPAASRSSSLHCCGGFTGLWTNRIGARAAILGCAKTCPEEIHPFTSARAHTCTQTHSHPPCCFELILKKSSCGGPQCWIRELPTFSSQGPNITRWNNDRNHVQIMHMYVHPLVVTGWETTCCTSIRDGSRLIWDNGFGLCRSKRRDTLHHFPRDVHNSTWVSSCFQAFVGWWPTWCLPPYSSWPWLWDLKTGGLKPGTIAGPTCKLGNSWESQVSLKLNWRESQQLFDDLEELPVLDRLLHFFALTASPNFFPA